VIAPEFGNTMDMNGILEGLSMLSGTDDTDDIDHSIKEFVKNKKATIQDLINLLNRMPYVYDTDEKTYRDMATQTDH
jgi:hypothetical protein